MSAEAAAQQLCCFDSGTEACNACSNHQTIGEKLVGCGRISIYQIASEFRLAYHILILKKTII
jgi:hypothetical protein